MGLMASWRVGNRAREIDRLPLCSAYTRSLQGCLREEIKSMCEALSLTDELHERAKALGYGRLACMRLGGRRV
jgi:hypothetical protein